MSRNMIKDTWTITRGGRNGMEVGRARSWAAVVGKGATIKK